jgi:hypothetical protein
VAGDKAKISPRHCLQQTRSVCAREQSDEAIHPVCRAMDCFAALAMTALVYLSAVARMERSVIRGKLDRCETAPDCAALHPGYGTLNLL